MWRTRLGFLLSTYQPESYRTSNGCAESSLGGSFNRLMPDILSGDTPNSMGLTLLIPLHQKQGMTM